MRTTLLNEEDNLKLNDAELKIIIMVRRMKLFDKVEIKYSKQGELQWQLTETCRGTYLRSTDPVL